MHVNLNDLTASGGQKFNQEQIKPGTIWEISRFVQSPIEFSAAEQQSLYSDLAIKFLNGDSPPRYAMIVKEPDAAIEQDDGWQVVSVMLLSVQTDLISNRDILIPANVSGFERDLLAHTWQVLPMLARNLSHSVGRRLSRQVYDVLLSVGDYHYSLTDVAPSVQEIELLELKTGAAATEQQGAIQAFHQQQEAWSDVLQVPLAAYYSYRKTMKLTNAVLNSALQIEQELSEVGVEKYEQSDLELHDSAVTTVKSATFTKSRLRLTQWFENIFTTYWQPTENLWNSQLATCRSGDRSNKINSNSSEEISVLINQIAAEQDGHKQRQAIKRLGEISFGNAKAITVLINLLRTSQDDETLWTAVESLWQIDPGNPAAGVSRARLIDLGMQLAGYSVALAVALIQKLDQQVGILLRVYPTDNEAYLPTNLKLILLDESEQILREVTARRADVYIQIKLSGYPGEKFSIRVALRDTSITDDFVI